MSNFSTLQNMCDPVATHMTTNQDLNSTRTETNECMSSILEIEEEIMDIGTITKIQFYRNLEIGIWRIFPPILLGKK